MRLFKRSEAVRPVPKPLQVGVRIVHERLPWQRLPQGTEITPQAFLVETGEAIALAVQEAPDIRIDVQKVADRRVVAKPAEALG